MVKKLRSLTQTHLEMIDTQFIHTYQGLTNFYTSLFKFNMNFYKLIKVIIPFVVYRLPRLRKGASYQAFQDEKYAYVNYLRKMNNKIMHFDWFMKSLGNVKFVIKKYYKYEDVGKQNPELYQLLKLYFPVTWCFGTYEQFAFKGMQEQLMAVTQNNVTEVNLFFQPKFFDSVVNSNKEGAVDINL